jgi:hypothetical protein
MLPWLIQLSHKFICYYSTEEIVIDCSNQQRGMYGTYNSICSLATTTAAIVVLGDWFLPSSASPFQLRFEERGYDSGEGLLLGLAAR